MVVPVGPGMSKHVIRMPGGAVAFAPAGDAEAAQRVVDARHEFVVGYCQEKGWPHDDLESLSWEQIIEIRSQQGWKDAGAGVSTAAIIVGGDPE